MNFKHSADEASVWTTAPIKTGREKAKVRSMSLVEFLELISMADFSFRYIPGDQKTLGIEGRHEILKDWIAELKLKQDII